MITTVSLVDTQPYIVTIFLTSLVAQTVKCLAYNAGDVGSIPGLGRFSGEGNGNPLQYSCLENSMEEELGAGYYPWGRRESGTTEQLHFT